MYPSFLLLSERMKTSSTLTKPSNSFTELTRSLENIRKNKFYIKSNQVKSDKLRKLPLLKYGTNKRVNDSNFLFIDRLLDAKPIMQRRMNKFRSNKFSQNEIVLSFESKADFLNKSLPKWPNIKKNYIKKSNDKNYKLNNSWKSDQLLTDKNSLIGFESDSEEVNVSLISKTPTVGILKSPDKLKRPKSKVSFGDESLIGYKKQSANKRTEILETDCRLLSSVTTCDTDYEVMYSNPNRTRENTAVSSVDHDRINYLFENKQNHLNIRVIYNDNNKKAFKTSEIL